MSVCGKREIHVPECSDCTALEQRVEALEEQIAALATVARTGSYSDLIDTPTIPTKTSELTNDSSFVSDANYVHTDNNYTSAEKNKLAGIEAGAEVNQNAFSKIKVGSTLVEADSKTDTVEFIEGSNVTITPDATNDTITFDSTGGGGSADSRVGTAVVGESVVGSEGGVGTDVVGTATVG